MSSDNRHLQPPWAGRLATALVAVTLASALGAGYAEAQSGGIGDPGTTASPATPPPTATATGEPPAPSVRLLAARARPGNAYYYGVKPPRFAITIAAKGPTDIRVDIRGRGVGLLRSITQLDVASGVNQVIPWDGLTASGTAPQGRLRFVVVGINGEPIAQSKKFTGKTNFGSYDHIFPLRAKHTYGDGLGAGRGHQGQDLAAPCGSKLVAARGGTVQASAYQAGGAGYYVVIDGLGTEFDYSYLHMLSPAIVTVGETVKTGQPIGLVGSTGRSTGCHLHFEMWSAPGWYEGGTAMDPSPWLRAWDAYS